MTIEKKFEELMYYTLSKMDEAFIHQNVVDAYAAQNTDLNTKRIKLFFALAGLYLSQEKGYTGKEVQNAHVKMTKITKDYPNIIPPDFRGDVTIDDVLKSNPGIERDTGIRKWCESVWGAYQDQHELIRTHTDRILKLKNF